MTYIHHKDLERMRAEGNAPQGGSLPARLHRSLIEAEIPDGFKAQLKLLDSLFEAAEVYPNDPSSLHKIGEVIGRQVAAAEIFYPKGQQALRSELANRFQQ